MRHRYWAFACKFTSAEQTSSAAGGSGVFNNQDLQMNVLNAAALMHPGKPLVMIAM
jgi:hypothetical protein